MPSGRVRARRRKIEARQRQYRKNAGQPEWQETPADENGQQERNQIPNPVVHTLLRPQILHETYRCQEGNGDDSVFSGSGNHCWMTQYIAALTI